MLSTTHYGMELYFLLAKYVAQLVALAKFLSGPDELLGV